MNRFQRSWELFKSAVSVMFRQKQLLFFPLVILGLTLVIAALFLTPVIALAVARGEFVGNHHHAADQPFNRGVSLYFIGTYFISMFCATFFNVAFYHEILEALQGRPVSISNGLRFACTRWKSILLWSVFAGLVGYIIRALEERFGLFGRIIMALVGTAWSVACVFAIPVIIEDESTANPLEVLKKSVLTLKRTWGESLIGFVGVSFGSWIIMILSIVWLGGAFLVASMLQSIVLGAIVFSLWLLAMVVFGYLTSVANQIFRCALYLYATGGTMPLPFNNDMAALAWKTKKK